VPDNVRPLPPEPAGEFSSAWRRFVQSLRRLLAGVPEDRSLAPFMPLRDTILDASERADIVAALEQSWLELHRPLAPSDYPSSPESAHLLLMELTAFPSSLEIAESEEANKSTNKVEQVYKKRALSTAKTVLDSTHDILGAHPITKGILKVLGEVIDLFRGN